MTFLDWFVPFCSYLREILFLSFLVSNELIKGRRAVAWATRPYSKLDKCHKIRFGFSKITFVEAVDVLRFLFVASKGASLSFITPETTTFKQEVDDFTCPYSWNHTVWA